MHAQSSQDLLERVAALEQANARLQDQIRAAREEAARTRLTAERFHVFFAACPFGIVLIDPAHRLVDGNPAFCAFLGYAPEELQQLQASDIVLAEDLETEQWLFAAAAVQGSLDEYTFDKRFRRRDGSVV